MSFVFGQHSDRKRDETYLVLHQKYYLSVYRYLSHFFSQTQDREDALQEIFYTIYRKLPQLDPKRSPGPWVYALARNQAISMLRKKGRIQEIQMEPAVLENLGICHEAPQINLEWEDILGQLSLQEKELAHLRFTQAMPLLEIAQVLGVKPGTIKSRLNALRGKLKPLLFPEGGEGK